MRSSGMPTSESPGLTVIIPTLNRAEYISQTVDELLSQHYQPLEIMIVDQSEQPDTRLMNLAQSMPGTITYFFADFRSLPAARNFGVKRARHDAILFLDDDIHCSPRLLAEHVRTLQEPGVGVVAGAVEEAAHAGKPPDEPTGRVDRLTGVPTQGFHVSGEFDVQHGKGCNFSVWREVFEKCGGIDEILNIGAALYEEADFCRRAAKAGYRIRFNGAARILHLAVPRGGCRVHVPEKYAFGLSHNRAVFIRRHVEWVFWPSALGRLLVTAVSLSLRNGDPRVLAASMRGARRGFLAATRPAVPRT